MGVRHFRKKIKVEKNQSVNIVSIHICLNSEGHNSKRHFSNSIA